MLAWLAAAAAAARRAVPAWNLAVRVFEAAAAACVLKTERVRACVRAATAAEIRGRTDGPSGRTGPESSFSNIQWFPGLGSHGAKANEAGGRQVQIVAPARLRTWAEGGGCPFRWPPLNSLLCHRSAR
jgi:hypothetical protein